MPRTPVRLDLVYAEWCPHCVPASTERAPLLAQRLGVPLRKLDIDRPDEEAIADQLVRDHGDWSEDYLIPQLFLEWDDGEVSHLLTGVPGPVAGTIARWEGLFRPRGSPRATRRSGGRGARREPEVRGEGFELSVGSNIK